jgi:hypothetical protein
MASVLASALALTLLPGGSVQASSTLPDVEIILLVQIDDQTGWLALHDAVLGTSREAPKPLMVSAVSAAGGRKTIGVVQPRFDTQIYIAPGVHSVRVMVSGKVPGPDALRSLTPFQASVLAIQSGAMDNELLLGYGLFGVRAELLELHIGRP